MAGSALVLLCGTPQGFTGPESRGRACQALLRSALQHPEGSEPAKYHATPIGFPFTLHRVNHTPLPTSPLCPTPTGVT